MDNAISDPDPEADNPQAGRKVLADRLKAMIDRIVDDAPEELFDGSFTTSWDGALPGRDGSPKWSFFGEKDLDDLRRAVALRMFRATQDALRDASTDALMSSLVSATDLGALARFVSGVQFSDAVTELDPLAAPVARAIAHRRALKSAAGEMLASSQVEELLGVRRQAIDKRRKSGRLLAVMIASDWFYPALQFTDGAVDPLMESVLGAHKDDDPWAILDALLAKDDAFGGRTVLDLVRDRDSVSLDRYRSQLEGDGFA
ncbi:hypothetical protein [Roseovarius sp. Pro17]|uniref:hypothetical protein n=1 Tax=Roseovarius sp. Pro17 TaxID=3108175 RepID=UPI002D7916F1|nr:hypothetical protein [Roseovarius sp. Pro17]